MSEKETPPPKDAGEYSAFKNLLNKIAKVPKSEIKRSEKTSEDEHGRRQRKAR